MPYLEINLKKIFHNAKNLKKNFESKKISIIGITKVTLGNPDIAKTFVQAGISYLGDSRIKNIIRMREAGVPAQFILIRNPALSEIPLVVKNANISLNSELEIIKKLSKESILQKKKHGIILMVEMGDLREGILVEDLEGITKEVLKLKGIELLGIGTNLKCFAGVIPDENNMKAFSEIAMKIQNNMEIKLNFVSGGNSANYDWLMTTKNVGLINNLRIGTAILLGVGGINEASIPGLYKDAFTLIAEIIELKKKPAMPKGTMSTNAFGEPSIFKDKDKFRDDKIDRNQALLNLGRQDIQEKGLSPRDDVEILSASSDYLIIDIKENNFKVGDQLKFDVNYEALLKAMTSPFISKKWV